MDWVKILGEAIWVAIIGWTCAILLIKRHVKRQQMQSVEEKDPCEWFEVESVEDLGRKIHAGIVLLNRQARSEKWDDRKKDAFVRASRHIEAAHYEVTRLVRN